MRILTLSLKNLNSLKGNWHIDFTDPAYDDSGIFAITGQTGAGKTTILDAICLALYGKTPRVEISKSTNEVMSRGCFECSAEIEIDIKGTLYRCQWSQYRARKKADGKLQDITHTLSEIKNLGDNNGKIIESKSSLTKKKIIETVGMDFEQFTRSVLLAQGDFSKFLKAKSDDRANILEKITGTDIYANISRRVYDRKRTNEQKLKELTASLDGIELMSIEDIEQINSQLTTQKIEQEKYNITLTTLSEQINWQNTITQLNKEIASQTTELTTAKQAQTDFAENATRLAQALKALEIESDYQQLERTRKQYKEQIDKQTLINKQIPLEKSNLSLANEQLSTAEITCTQAETSLNEQLPIISEVKILDNELANIEQRLEEKQAQHTQLSNSLNERKQLIIDNQHNIATSKADLQQIDAYLIHNANHANLNIDRENLTNTCKSIKSLLLANANAQNELDSHAEQGKQLAVKKQALQQQTTLLNQKVNNSLKQLNTLEIDIANVLNSKSIADWRAESTRLNDRQHQLNTLEQKHQQFSELSTKVKILKITGNNLHNDKQQLDNDVSEQKKALDILTQQFNDRNETLRLQQHIIKLEQYIDTLQDDEACPLCGATDHPYLSDVDNGSHPHFAPKHSHVDRLNELQTQLDNVKKTIDVKQNKLNESERKKVSIITKLEEINKQHQESKSHYDSLEATIKNELSNLIFRLEGVDDIVLDNLPQQIQTLQTQNQQDSHACQHVIEQCEQLENQRTQNKTDSDNLTAQLNQIHNQFSEIHTQYQLFEQQQAHIQEGMTHTFVNLNSQKNALEQVLSRHNVKTPHQLTDSLYNVQILSEVETKSVLDELRNIVKDWQALEQTYITKDNEKIEREKQISNVQSKVDEWEKQQRQTQQEFEQLTNTLNAQHADYQHQLVIRHQLFADKNPITEENNLRELTKTSQTALNTAKQQQQRLQYTLEGLSQTLSELVTSIASTKMALDSQQQQFTEQLSNHHFSDMNHFTSALLPQSEREQLQNQQSEINAQVERLQTLLDNNQQLLNEQTSKMLTEMPLAQLEKSKEDTETIANELAQKIGANQQKIIDNEKRKAQCSEQQQAIDTQQQANKIWEQLNILIGSSEGKKFRIFAQGLTFDDMIRGANEQLQKMSDRYLLIRDTSENSKEALEINVIDNYQAGEIRSCKNLSGGESFIISLALALGLSKMASNSNHVNPNSHANANMSVDSLFLDEGFGTLDEDSLEIALETLTHLRQQGKLIGVISHVQALKDRIHTQIKVEKRSGGVSRLSGAGISGT